MAFKNIKWYYISISYDIKNYHWSQLCLQAFKARIPASKNIINKLEFFLSASQLTNNVMIRPDRKSYACRRSRRGSLSASRLSTTSSQSWQWPWKRSRFFSTLTFFLSLKKINVSQHIIAFLSICQPWHFSFRFSEGFVSRWGELTHLFGPIWLNEYSIRCRLSNVCFQEQNIFIDKLKAAIRAKGPPLKVRFVFSRRWRLRWWWQRWWQRWQRRWQRWWLRPQLQIQRWQNFCQKCDVGGAVVHSWTIFPCSLDVRNIDRWSMQRSQCKREGSSRWVTN